MFCEKLALPTILSLLCEHHVGERIIALQHVRPPLLCQINLACSANQGEVAKTERQLLVTYNFMVFVLQMA